MPSPTNNMSVLEVARGFSTSKMASADVIRWAERMLAADTELADHPVIMELAWLSVHRDENETVEKLLTKLVADAVSFEITDADKAQARSFTQEMLKEQAPGSITRDNCIDFVLGSCPQIAVGLQEERELSGIRRPGLYSELGPYIECIVQALRPGDESLTVMLQCLEHLFELGTEEVQGAASVGVIEGVVNTCSHEDMDMKPFQAALLPLSRAAYDELIRFW